MLLPTVVVVALAWHNNTVTYHDVANRRVLRGVQHPKLLEELGVGDLVSITYTRARAASIEQRR